MKKLRIFCDKSFVIPILIVDLLISIPLCILCIYVCISSLLILKSTFDIICCSFCLLIPLIWIGLSFFVIVPNFLAFVEFSKDGICLNTIYKKTAVIPYNEFGNFQIAGYMQWSIPRLFIVMASITITEEQRYHINKVQNSEHLVKIQLTKRNYERLRRILPPEQREKLKSLFGDTTSGKGFDIKEYFRRKELKEKKKRREKQRKTNRKIRKK